MTNNKADTSIPMPIIIIFGTVFEILIILAVYLFAFEDGRSHATEIFQKEAIEKCYAEYNQFTGEWQWRTTK